MNKKPAGKPPMYARIHRLLTDSRLQWLLAHEIQPITSIDLLEHALSTTRIIKQAGDMPMLVDWMKNYLIPALDEVREWALEVLRDEGKQP